MFFCPKCNGILTVSKVHEEKDITKPRLCDVACMECGHEIYYQPYDDGSRLNLVPTQKKE